MQFKYIEVDTSKELHDHEVKIEGVGLVVLSAPLKSYIKLNSKLSDPIPAITIEKLYAPIEKIYVTSPADITNLKLLVIRDYDVYIDSNTNYDVVASIGAFMGQMILSSAKRGNHIVEYTLDPASAPITIQEPYIVGPYLIENIIGFTVLSGNLDGWKLDSAAIHPTTKEVINSAIDLTGLTEGDQINLISYQYVFSVTDSTIAQPAKIAVDFLYIPIWSK